MAWTWTPERDEALKKLWLSGMSAAQVARALDIGVSRNAVIGRIYRLQANGRLIARTNPSAPRPRRGMEATPRPPPQPKQHRAKPVLKVVGSTVFERPPEPPPKAIPPRHDAFAPIPGYAARPWVERGADECKWPVGGTGADTLACCAPVMETGRPYCAEHHARAHQPPQAKKARSANDMTRSLRRYG